MRIKELEDVLKLVDEMPRERQMWCVEHLAREVNQWEERVSFNGDDTQFLMESIRRRRERRAAEEKKRPPG